MAATSVWLCLLLLLHALYPLLPPSQSLGCGTDPSASNRNSGHACLALDSASAVCSHSGTSKDVVHVCACNFRCENPRIETICQVHDAVIRIPQEACWCHGWVFGRRALFVPRTAGYNKSECVCLWGQMEWVTRGERKGGTCHSHSYVFVCLIAS